MHVIRYWPIGAVPSYWQGTMNGSPVFGRLADAHHFRSEANAAKQLAALARYDRAYAVVPLQGEDGKQKSVLRQAVKQSSRGTKARRLVRR